MTKDKNTEPNIASPTSNNPTPAANKTSGRKVSLDIVRGSAALMIVLFHFTGHYNDYIANLQLPYGDINLPLTLWWGYAAVVSFFMLSGYLAATVLQRRHRTPWQYVRHKLKRFYPAFWVAMTVSVAAIAIFGISEPVSWVQYFANLTMVSQLMRVPFVDGVYWSMQCELVFCLIVAALLLVREQSVLNRLLLGWIVLAIVVNIIPGKALRIFRIILISNYAHTFVSGLVIARLNNLLIGRRLALCILGLCLANCSLEFGPVGPSTAFLVGTGVILYAADKLDRRIATNNLVVRVLCWIATISYPLYLVHSMLGFGIISRLVPYAHTQAAHCAVVVVAVLCVLPIAWLIHRYIERH